MLFSEEKNSFYSFLEDLMDMVLGAMILLGESHIVTHVTHVTLDSILCRSESHRLRLVLESNLLADNRPCFCCRPTLNFYESSTFFLAVLLPTLTCITIFPIKISLCIIAIHCMLSCGLFCLFHLLGLAHTSDCHQSQLGCQVILVASSIL